MRCAPAPQALLRAAFASTFVSAVPLSVLTMTSAAPLAYPAMKCLARGHSCDCCGSAGSGTATATAAGAAVGAATGAARAIGSLAELGLLMLDCVGAVESAGLSACLQPHCSLCVSVSITAASV